MFHQYKFISVNHHVALESCIRNHPGIGPAQLAKLYELADRRLTDNSVNEAGISCSSVADTAQNIVVGTATQELTGIYVQLVKSSGSAPLLTVGTKWAVETLPLHTTGRQIKIW